jgi:hypothetical protein
MSTADTIEFDIMAVQQVVAAADQANLQHAIESVSWERRGFLQRLTRVEQPAHVSWSEKLALVLAAAS